MDHGILPAPTLRKQAGRALFLFGLTLLAACATGPRAPDGGPEAQLLAAAGLAAEGRHAEAATRYETLAITTLSARRDELLARAALAWLDAGDAERALGALRRADARRLDADGLARLALVRARIARAAGDLGAARTALDLDAARLGTEVRAAWHRERAGLEFELGRPLMAIEHLVVRDRLVSDQRQRRADQQRIWDALTRLRGALDPAALEPTADADFVRWVELAAIVRSAWHDATGANARLEAWQDANPSHPASLWLLPELAERLARRDSWPERVALLLPMTGRYAAQARAVRDGALAARYALGSDGPAEVVVHDTGDQPGGATRALAAAIADGARFVVGPLTREAVIELAAAGAPPVPVLALNYLDAEAATPDGLWQFGLSPEGEAEQVAEHAVARGFTRALALYPRGDWGQRMLRAFETRFQALGGVVLTAQMFDPVESDYSTAIMRGLNLDESRSRAQLLASMLGTRLEHEPRRRQDAEFVFVAARDREAPLLRTQLRFHRATALPVLATSHVYRPDGRADADLDGISFADMPWTVAGDEATVQTRERLGALWPEDFARHSRLYALGFDALRLVPMLANFPIPLAEPVPGATGVLSMGPGNRLRRDLYWARFVGGVPAPELDGATAPVPEPAEAEGGTP